MEPGKALAWPGGKRVAVLTSVLLETWAEGRSPTYFPRTTPLKAGLPDLPGHQWSRYGGAEGVWRVLEVLRRAGVAGTVFANALSAETYPDLIRAAVAHGHGVEAHGYAQNEYLLDLDDDAQQLLIRRCLDVLQRVGGRRPEGWVTPVYGSNAATHTLLAREGVRWHADALDTSLPRRQRTQAGAIIALPWSDFVDNRVLRASPRDYFDAYADMLEYLHEDEGFGLIHLAIHGHFGGRPLVSAQLARLLRHFSGFPGVWFATPGELVEWFDTLGVDEISVEKRWPALAVKSAS